MICCRCSSNWQSALLITRRLLVRVQPSALSAVTAAKTPRVRGRTKKADSYSVLLVYSVCGDWVRARSKSTRGVYNLYFWRCIGNLIQINDCDYSRYRLQARQDHSGRGFNSGTYLRKETE